jgi:hypothetical protein
VHHFLVGFWWDGLDRTLTVFGAGVFCGEAMLDLIRGAEFQIGVQPSTVRSAVGRQGFLKA